MRADGGQRFALTRDADGSGGGLRLTGRLVYATAADALRQLIAALPANGSSVVADLEGIQAGDSAGLATLVEWRAEAASRGIHLRLIDAPIGLRALARLADLDAELFA